MGFQTFRNNAHGIGGPGAKVTRIVYSPFLATVAIVEPYSNFRTNPGNGFILQRENPGTVRDWGSKS